jgi:hypothetical protein
MGNRIKKLLFRNLPYIRGAGSVLDVAGLTWTPVDPHIRTGSFSDDAAALHGDWIKHLPEFNREATGEHQRLLFS